MAMPLAWKDLPPVLSLQTFQRYVIGPQAPGEFVLPTHIDFDAGFYEHVYCIALVVEKPRTVQVAIHEVASYASSRSVGLELGQNYLFDAGVALALFRTLFRRQKHQGLPLSAKFGNYFFLPSCTVIIFQDANSWCIETRQGFIDLGPGDRVFARREQVPV